MQITVRAADRGVPPRTADIQAQVSIRRNQNLTVFDRTEYEVSKAENSEIGETITRVRATDKDVGFLLFDDNLF